MPESIFSGYAMLTGPDVSMSLTNSVLPSIGPAAALKAERIPGIELLRAVCALLVILIHTTPLKQSSDPVIRGLGDFINVMARVAVPFFFFASGYFFTWNVGKTGSGQITRFIKKMLLIYLAWFCFYALFDIYWMNSPLFSWKRLNALFGFYSSPAGTSARHLWFFPVLIYSMFITALARRFLRPEFALGIMVLIFLIGNIPPAYRSFLPRWVSPVFSAPFFFAGAFLADRTAGRKVPAGKAFWVLALLAALLQFPDFLARRHFLHVIVESYFLFTMAAVVLLFLAGLQLQTGHKRLCHLLGSYSLGVYAVHLLYLYITGAMPELKVPGLARDVLRPLMITVASVATVFVLKKIPYARKIC